MTLSEKIDYLFSKINWGKSNLDAKSIEIMNNLQNDIQEFLLRNIKVYTEYPFVSLKWIPTKDKLPKESQTVWAYNNKTKFIALACLTYQEDTWLWAVSNGIIYSENNEIISECELDDDYDFTHWMELPQLPK